MRLFIAVELPPSVRDRLRAVAESLHPVATGARWSRPEGIHLTLAFLGETEEERVEELARAMALATAGTAPFVLHVKGGGGFGSHRAPRVLWVGVDGATETLASVHSALWGALEPLGWTPEKRAFRPHLTLARAREPRGDRDLALAAEQLADFEGGKFEVDRLTLFRSQLGRGGATYTALREAHFPRG